MQLAMFSGSFIRRVTSKHMACQGLRQSLGFFWETRCRTGGQRAGQVHLEPNVDAAASSEVPNLNAMLKAHLKAKLQGISDADLKAVFQSASGNHTGKLPYRIRRQIERQRQI